MSRRAADALRWGVRIVLALELILVLGCAMQALFWDRIPPRYPPPGRLVDVGDHRLHVFCEGEGVPTVIFEAGGTHFSTQYRSLQRDLASHTRACAYDRAGMGWSESHPAPLSTRALVDDLVRLIDDAALRGPYVLVGSSAGGLTVELFAREHADDVVGLVLLDAAQSEMLQKWPERHADMTSDACRARTLNRLGVLRFLDPLGRNQLAEDSEREAAFAYRDTTWSAICSLLSSATPDDFRYTPPLPNDMPLIVIRRGRAEDPPFESEWQAGQEASAARSRKGELVVAGGSGHHIWQDQPELVIRAVLQLVTRYRRL